MNVSKIEPIQTGSENVVKSLMLNLSVLKTYQIIYKFMYGKSLSKKWNSPCGND